MFVTVRTALQAYHLILGTCASEGLLTVVGLHVCVCMCVHTKSAKFYKDLEHPGTYILYNSVSLV